MPVTSGSDPYHELKMQLLAQIGFALVAWSMVESVLSLLFRTISEMPNYKKAGAAFDAIIAFETRLAVCNALMAHEGLEDIEQEIWNRLSRRISKFYKKRHEVAHFSMFTGDVMTTNPTIKPFFTWDKHDRNDFTTLNYDQIKERAEKFNELEAAIRWFIALLHERKGLPLGPLSPSSEEPPLIPRLRDTAIQILQGQTTRHPPSSE